MRPTFVLLLCNLLAVGSAWALDPHKDPHQHLHRAWRIDDGLPQNTVDGIEQTRDGYLWFATQEGLVRYDGLTFDVFDRYNTPALLDPTTTALAEGANGGLWIGSNQGLVRYANGVFSLFTTEDGLPNMQITCLAPGRQGEMWIGTRIGLARHHHGRITAWTKADGLTDNHVMSLAPAADGSLWVGTSRGLLHYQNQRFVSRLEGRRAVGRGVAALLAERDGTVWAGTLGGGVVAFGTGGPRTFRMSDGLPSDDVTALLRDRDGNLWIGTYQNGLIRFYDHHFFTLTTEHGLSSNWIAALFEDREGNLWVGTGTAGVNRFWDGRFTNLTVADGLLDNMVWGVYQAPDDSMWIGSDRGATHIGAGPPQTLTPESGLAYTGPSAFLHTPFGFWIGTENGVSRLVNDRIISYTTADGLAHGDIRSLLLDRRGDLWIGTHGGGINRWRDGKFEVFDTRAGLVCDDVTGMLEDHQGALWIATDQGMSRFLNGTFTNFKRSQGFVDSRVFALYLDMEQVLWIGTDSGLYRYRDEELFSYTVADGLSDDRAYAILEDDDGHLWFSSNKGIYRVKKAHLHAFAAGHRHRIDSRLFGRQDGMRSFECNFAGTNAGWRTRDGRLWFATMAGVAIVDPAGSQRTDPPPILLRSVTADGTSLPLGSSWTSPPGVQNVEFQYTAPSFIAPEDLTFTYRLLGLDDRWRDAGHRRVVTYANLAPGRYTFEVVAVANDGSRSRKPAVFAFFLRPTFFQTVYFYFLVGLSAVVLGLLFHFWRLRRHKLRQAVLERMVQHRTEQLSIANEKLTQLSFRDALTGLRNRRFLLDTIPGEVAAVARQHHTERRKTREESGLVFVMIDLDRFKQVNDTHGHAAGDQVLIQAAQLLENIARTSDTIARWGGEEFLMVARRVDRDAARHLAERIREAFAENRFDLGNGETITVTCSLGYALYPFVIAEPSRFDWEEVVAIADQALYAAKHSGRAMWVGLHSTPHTDQIDLPQMHLTGVAPLLAQDQLRVESSFDEARLIWPSAS